VAAPLKNLRAKKKVPTKVVVCPDPAHVVMPEEFRYKLTSPTYAYKFIKQVLRTAGRKASVRDVARAFALMSDRSLLQEIGKGQQLDTAIADYNKSATQPAELYDFMPAVRKLIENGLIVWHGEGIDGSFELVEDASINDDDCWIVADATLSLMLVKGLPDIAKKYSPFEEIEELVSLAFVA